MFHKLVSLGSSGWAMPWEGQQSADKPAWGFGPAMPTMFGAAQH